MVSILDTALAYLRQGISITISDPKSKRPIYKWAEFQTKLPTEAQVKAMFAAHPKAMLAIITGELSHILVVDCDSPEAIQQVEDALPDSFESTIAVSPRGGRHYYFACANGRWQTKSAVLKNIDIRANGGVIVAPPSQNETGCQYRWLTGLDFDKTHLQEMPESLCKLLESAQVEGKPKFVVDLKSVEDLFKEGRRDSDLFHLALALRKSGESREYVLQVLTKFTNSWKENKDLKYLNEKVASAFQHEEKKERNLAEEVRQWVTMTTGNFNVSDVHRELNLMTKEQKNSANKELSALTKGRIIEKYGEKRGHYRLVDNDLEEMKWYEVTDFTPYDIAMPFEIHKYVKIHKKSIIVVAGTSNAGKTAFMLNIINLNINKHKIRYFSSELSNEELAERINEFGLPKSDWNYETNFKCYSRSRNFCDVVDPDGLNIIDFLECYEDFFVIGKYIADIHSRLKSGVAIIALQKNPGQKPGLGGWRSVEKARLYLSVDPGVMEIIKGKSWVNRDINPNGMKLNFKLYAGCKFMPQSGWIHP